MLPKRSSSFKNEVKNNPVKNNVNVARKTEGAEEVLKQGVPNDISRKCEKEQIGLSIGVTLNTGNYQSLKVDVWYSSNIQENETAEQAYSRVKKDIEKALNETVEEYMPEE